MGTGGYINMKTVGYFPANPERMIMDGEGEQVQPRLLVELPYNEPNYGFTKHDIVYNSSDFNDATFESKTKEEAIKKASNIYQLQEFNI
jgi:hypothetical protein